MFCSCFIRFRICAWIDTSRADTGSSHTMNFGFNASALAIPILWRRPPSSSWGYVLIRRSARPTVSINSRTRSICSFLSVMILLIFNGSAMIWLMVLRGFKLENGSWKMICMSVRFFRISSADSFTTSWPSNSTSPAVGSIRRRIARPVVDFPQPDSPTTPNVFPFSIVKVTSSTACSIPFGVLKYFLRFFTSSSGWLIECSPSLHGCCLYCTGGTPHSGYRSGTSSAASASCRSPSHTRISGRTRIPSAGCWDPASGP